MVFLCHTHRSKLFSVWWQGGVERNGVFLAHAPEATVFWYRNRMRWDRTVFIPHLCYGDVYGTSC